MKTILSELKETISLLKSEGFHKEASDLTSLFQNLDDTAKKVETYSFPSDSYDPDNPESMARYEEEQRYKKFPEEYMTPEEQREKLGPTKLSPDAAMGPEEMVPTHRVEEYKSIKPIRWKVTRK